MTENIFAEAKQRLDDFAEIERRHKQTIERACDWKDEEDRLQYYKDMRQLTRSQLIDELAPNRQCKCGVTCPETNMWIVFADGTKALCRPCYAAERAKLKWDGEPIGDLFTEPEIRFKLDAAQFTRARQAAGITMSQFAILMCWSRTYQGQLESGKVQTLSEFNARRVLQIFQEKLTS